MTTQQLKDYEKVQPLELLALWTECVTQYKGMTLKALPLRCAISDMEAVISDGEAELDSWQGFDEYDVIKNRIKQAKRFLSKYAK